MDFSLTTWKAGCRSAASIKAAWAAITAFSASARSRTSAPSTYRRVNRLEALAACVAGLLPAVAALATNPLITDQFTADPTARVFEGRVYVYPSHDIAEPP